MTWEEYKLRFNKAKDSLNISRLNMDKALLIQIAQHLDIEALQFPLINPPALGCWNPVWIDVVKEVLIEKIILDLE